MSIIQCGTGTWMSVECKKPDVDPTPYDPFPYGNLVYNKGSISNQGWGAKVDVLVNDVGIIG